MAVLHGFDGASKKLDNQGTFPNQTPTCYLEDTRFKLDEPICNQILVSRKIVYIERSRCWEFMKTKPC